MQWRRSPDGVLDDMEKEILIMHFENGIPFTKIAKELGMDDRKIGYICRNALNRIEAVFGSGDRLLV